MTRSPAVGRLATGLLPALLLLSACGSDTPPEPGVQHAASRLAEVASNANDNCQCTDASAINDCKNGYEEYMKLELSFMMAQYPGVKVDQAKFDTCMADFAKLLGTCPSSYALSDIASCSTASGGPLFFTGMQTEGEKCAGARSCVEGLGCDVTLGTCQPLKALSESCAAVGCQTGLFCDNTRHCAQQGAASAACDPAQAQSCQEGLTCLATGHTCQAPHALGENCTDGAGCVDGAYCSTTCLAKKNGGEACSSGSECLSRSCTAAGCAAANFCTSGIFGA